RPPLFLRVNTLLISRDELKELLEEEGYSVETSPLSDTALTVEGAGSPAASPLFEKGYFFIQDAASQYASSLLDPKPGENVADVCACPGGKSFSCAMLMENRGNVFSFDLHRSKISLIESGAKRLGIGIITASAHDSTKTIDDLAGAFDRVICDVPCSGLGVISKKPDIRSKKESDISRLPEIQSEILEASSEYLKLGGTLLYSTCTLNPDENEKVTDSFLARHGNFRRAARGSFPKTLFPKHKISDGFFIDLLERTE
ncbi:MAG: 16S rRNA (cytosine(967)-C(5))-methyltransferase RsmB, partial [Clostridia bacterium]|nr:16S rRNA (cytosine(967)-C(5))-methyltransferase RsmB [Clostridia bacterium]